MPCIKEVEMANSVGDHETSPFFQDGSALKKITQNSSFKKKVPLGRAESSTRRPILEVAGRSRV